jgi:hypothetical protein
MRTAPALSTGLGNVTSSTSEWRREVARWGKFGKMGRMGHEECQVGNVTESEIDHVLAAAAVE